MGKKVYGKIREGNEYFSLWKEREMNTFPSLSIYYFSHFSLWGKIGKHTFFHRQKWDWTPQIILLIAD